MLLAAEPPATPVTEVVLYSFNTDTSELLRYSFAEDDVQRIGIVRDQHGAVVSDVEGLTIIPDGPYQGLYGVANWFLTQPSRLVRIDGADGSAYAAAAPVGFDKVEGLVACRNENDGRWSLLGVAREPRPSLIRIDPLTGIGTPLMSTEQRYRGLAAAPDGTLLGVTADRAALWKIDPFRQLETQVGELTEYRTIGALEFAKGDHDGPLAAPEGMRLSAQPAGGLLFGFSEDEDALLIIDAVSGRAHEWECAFRKIDSEGIAFTTRGADPWAAIASAGR